MPEADVADELYGGQPGQGEQPSVEQRSGDAGFAAQLLYVELRIGRCNCTDYFANPVHVNSSFQYLIGVP